MTEIGTGMVHFLNQPVKPRPVHGTGVAYALLLSAALWGFFAIVVRSFATTLLNISRIA